MVTRAATTEELELWVKDRLAFLTSRSDALTTLSRSELITREAYIREVTGNSMAKTALREMLEYALSGENV